MPRHRFCIGQEVEYFTTRRFDRLAGDLYTVFRLLPFDGTGPQYRIKSSLDGRERAVHEDEIGVCLR